MTGSDLKLDGHAAGLRHQRRNEPIVLMQFTGSGGEKFHDITRELVERGRSWPTRRAARRRRATTTRTSSSRSSSTARSGRAPSIDFNDNPDGIPGNNGAQITGHRLDQRGEEPRARAPDRRAARQVHHDRADGHLGDARQGLAQAGQERCARRPDPRRALPAALLPLPRPRRGHRPRRSTRAFLYAAILLFNVTLTLPGFAGLILTIGVAADANVVIFERIKEEVRAGQIRARRDRRGLREGLRTRSSTRTS